VNPQRIRRSTDALTAVPHHGGGMNLSIENSPVAEKVDELERTADAGVSGRTPLIVLGEVWVACAVLSLAVLALTLLAIRIVD